MSEKQDELQPIIVKKIKKGGGGHHGGAWKVAYADFVTAMMAFFLLLWLLNVTTEEQKMGIADYFNPNPRISENKSGAGGIMGGLTISPEGAMTSNLQPLQPQTQLVNPALRPATKAMQEKRKKEQERFDKAKATLDKAIKDSPALAALSKHLMIDETPEGLRIQIVDQEGEPMFAPGSADMLPAAVSLLREVAKTIKGLPNELSVRGHTDSSQYAPGASYTNWELSSDRAHSSRRQLLESALEPGRINNVMGKADTEHLYPDAPKDARNRRISIILLKEELTDPDFGSEEGEGDAQGSQTGGETGEESTAPDIREFNFDNTPEMPSFDDLYEKTPGEVEFP